MSSAKPVIHGRDHAPGGADPVPGVGDGIQFGGTSRVYGPDNQGGYLDITTNETDPNGLGMSLTNFGTGGIQIQEFSGSGIRSIVTGQGGYTVENTGDDPIQILNEGNAAMLLENQGTDAMTLHTSGGGIFLTEDGGGDIVADSGHDVTVHADHKVVITSGNDTNITASNTALLRATNGLTVLSDSGPIHMLSNQTGTSATLDFRIEDGCYLSVFETSLASEWLRVGSAGIFMFHLPTSNPGGSGQLWNSAGTVKVT